MSSKGTVAAVGAIGSSLATLACCLPVGMMGAAGALATFAAFAQAGRPWLLGLSIIFLGTGFTQAWQVKRCGAKRNWLAVALLLIAAVVVVLVALFPQLIASWLADVAE